MKLPRPSHSVVTEEGIRFQLFFIRKTVPWPQIKAVHLVPFWKVLWWGVSRPMVSLGSADLGTSVIVETVSGWFVLINPTDKNAFIALAKKRLSELGR